MDKSTTAASLALFARRSCRPRADLVLARPAPRVGRHGRIVVSVDGDDTWEPAADGIDVPMPDMVELFVAAPDGTVWAICPVGRLLVAFA